MLKKIWAFITGASKKVKIWLNFGKELANDLKEMADSPLLDAFVKITANKYDDAALAGVRLALNIFIKAMGWEKLNVAELADDHKAVVLHSLSAVAAKAISDTQGGSLTIQTTLSTQQLIYDANAVQQA